jgi:hypothetical protein
MVVRHCKRHCNVSEQVDGRLNSVFSNFNPNNRKVNSNNDNRDNANDNNVVRLSGSGMALQIAPSRGCF